MKYHKQNDFETMATAIKKRNHKSITHIATRKGIQNYLWEYIMSNPMKK